MTANVMASDKAACLDAGMVDHIGKPIDLDQLIAALRRHINPERLAIAHSDALAQAVEVSASANETSLDSETAIKRLGNSRELYDQVVHSFRTDTPTQLADLNHQIEQAAFTDAIRTAHTIKGLAATIGAMALSKTAGQIEAGLKEQSKAGSAALAVSELLAQLNTQFEALLPELAKITPELSSSPVESAGDGTFDQAVLSSHLAELKQLLADDDMRATSLGNKIGQTYGTGLGPDWQAVAQAINQLDFAAALDACTLLQDRLAEND
jgi:HPt (histidine-containing phosphotransfer) domain-containing protein